MSGLKSVVVFCFSFAVGISFFFYVSDKVNSTREPAAINGKIFQISSLSPEQIKTQLTKKLRVLSADLGIKKIQLSGFSSTICTSYKTIEITFQAEGMSVNGTAPEMTISAPCKAAQDPSEIAALAIPVQQIINGKPRSAEFSFVGFEPKYTFINAGDEWPRTWILKKMSFKNDSGEEKLINFQTRFAGADRDQHPIVLEF